MNVGYKLVDFSLSKESSTGEPLLLGVRFSMSRFHWLTCLWQPTSYFILAHTELVVFVLLQKYSMTEMNLWKGAMF